MTGAAPKQPSASGAALRDILAHGCRRPAQFLRPPARHGGAAVHRPRHPPAVDRNAGLRLLGIGYATPYLGLFREEAERCLAFMPAAQGVVKWPSARPTLDRARGGMRIAPARIPRSIASCWCMRWKTATTSAALLREVWRVLAAGGRILAVVPNRRGLWARMDTTPFGQGARIRARRSRICYGRPGSRRPPGATRFTSRRSIAAGFCARRSPGSAPARRFQRPSPGSTLSKRRSRSIAPSRRVRRS